MGNWNKAVVAYFKLLPQYFLEPLWKVADTLSDYSQSEGLGFKPETSQYEAGMLTTEVR
jgi:hypothetical protein